MTAQLRSELLKQRSTRANLGLATGMLLLVVFVVLLHGLALPVHDVSRRGDQLKLVLGWGELLGTLFAALLGALSVTGEFRHGTIRPTLLATPRRDRVMAAKVTAGMLAGAALGLIAAAAAAAVGSGALAARGVAIRVELGDYALLLAGCSAAAALWAAIGVGLGGLARNQAATLVGICAWLLFVESLLVGDVSLIGDAGRYTPGALAKAASGQGPLHASGLAVALLAIYAAVAAAAGGIAVTRRDVA